MKIQIEVDLEFYSGEHDDFVHDYIDDLTYALRSSRRLRAWDINYNIEER